MFHQDAENAEVTEESDSSEDSDNNDEDAASSTFEGVPELFAGAEADLERKEEETEVLEKAERIQQFKFKVLDIFSSQKKTIEKQINAAMDVQTTLRELLRDQAAAETDKDEDRRSFIASLVDEIYSSNTFVDQKGIVTLSADLDTIQESVMTLKELTSVKDEDEVRCTVCLSCPVGVIWDCIKCDHLVCHVCRQKITSCPTCRVRFVRHQPRRNRWAEKLARLQREKSVFISDD